MSKIIQLRSKLTTITRINKMMYSMQIMAAAHLKTAQNNQRAALHYREHYERLAKKLGVSIFPTTEKIAPVYRIYLIASERGFCGDFNYKLISELKRFRIENQKKEIKVVVFGKRGYSLCREERIQADRADAPASLLCANCVGEYLEGKVEKVFLIYNQFKSILNQKPVILSLLPLEMSSTADGSDLLIEPDRQTVKEFVAKNYLQAVFYDALAQSALGETASRLITMRQATESSKDMIARLNLLINKARQAAITFELSEIISSFNILGGGE